MEFASDLGVTTNDTDLQKLSPTLNPTFDCCILEFDLVPQAGRLNLNYIFASEEYPEYVCSNFGDVMAFYVSGPNPMGGMYNKLNIANVPGTNLTVCINTINPGVPGNSSGGGTCNLPGQSMGYSYLYHNNYLGTDIVYDGLTTLLTAGVNVVPGQVYHLKLAVADIFDQFFDSGIFLEAGSLNSSDYTVQTQGVSVGSNAAAAEGCYDGGFRFLLNKVSATPTTISFSIGGTAVNGVDYAAIDTFLTIAAADTVGIVNINPVNDGLAEGNETVKLYLRDLVNQQIFDSVTLYITDGIFADAQADKDTVCAGQQVTLTAGGGVTYAWAPAEDVADSTAQTTTATPVATSTYILTATAGTCTAYDTLTIQVDANTFTVNAGANTGICKYDTVQLQSTVVPDTGAYTMQWFTTTGTFISASANAAVSPTGTTSYVFEAAKGYCSAADTVAVTVTDSVAPITASANPAAVCAGQQVQLNITSNLQLCGVTNAPDCGNSAEVDTIKTGYNVQAGNPYTGVSLYGNFYKSMRMQMLYTGPELQSILGSAGTISKLAWQIGVFNSNASLENFTIALKCVPASQSTLTTWETGMKQVFTPKIVTPAVLPSVNNGWNTHSLDSLYDWDGQSGLVVEVCFYNPNTSSNLVNMMTYSNRLNTVLYSRSNNDECGSNNTPTSFSQRFNMRVHMCPPAFSGYTIAWSPATGPNAVSVPNVKNPTAAPVTAQTYLVTAGINGCTKADSITVTILNDTTCDTLIIGLAGQLERHFTVSPNPAHNYVTLNYAGFNPGKADELTLQVYNNTGVLVSRKVLPPYTSSYNLSLEGYAPGIYLLVFQQTGYKPRTVKLVKE